MVENFTLFFCYSNFDSENNLYTIDDLTEPEDLYTKELEKIFGRMDFLSPSENVITRILERI